ncbi:MAG TPA: hypothetical protein VMZ04_01825, partial [Anaerolineae bacterium]|nr:hypothetical protein [Anaerolineae bacterium]
MRMTIKNLTLYVPIFIFCFFSYIKIVSAEISLLSSSPRGLSISYRPSLGSVDTILYNNNMYIQFRYHNHTVRNHTGAPAIPSKTLFFAAPQGIIPSLKINYLSSSVSTDVIILPVPHLEEDNNGFQIEVYEEDPMSYALSGYKPRNFVELGTCVENGGISIWELVFTPVLYDARALSVAVADSFDVEVSFGTGIINTYTIATRIPQYIINKDLFKDMSIKKTTFITSDPFAKGDWYRIKLTQSGMYRIS